MSISKVTLNEPKRRNSMLSAAAIGGAAGVAARYLMPTKTEFSGLLNKQNCDTFMSNAATVARANGRSILKFAGVGALIATGISAIASYVKSHKNEAPNSEAEYSKLGIFVDASPYACEIYCYED